MNYYYVCTVLTIVIVIREGYCADDAKAETIRFIQEKSNKGNYRYSFETTNGLHKEETGELVNESSDEEYLSVRGSYSYVGIDGNTYVTYYVADKLGYRPKYEVLPPTKRSKDEEDKPTTEGEFVDFIGSAVLASLAG